MSTEKNPVVSVIVPARNEEDCLALCLESLAAQTEIDFEIIVVDDASTDRTAEIARSFSENPGQTASRAGTDALISTAYVGADALVRPRPARLSPDDRSMPRLTGLSAPPLPAN